MPTCTTCRAHVPDSARFCSDCGSPVAAPTPVEGERKFATVLFADVAHSTTLAERLDPEDWAAIMNGAFGFMNASITRYGGTVARLMGDAVLAFFGAPIAQEDHAERAVLAGLAIRDASREYAETLRQRFELDFAIRVGIHTGFSVLAYVGDAVKREYTSMGDTANVAARLQSAAPPGTVLVSGDTFRLVRRDFEAQARGRIELKGKGEPVESLEVLARRKGARPPRGVDGLHSPLVGREAEAATLRNRLAGLLAGRGHVVLVVGEAGLGKSRLVAELAGEIAASDDPPAWLEGRAVSHRQAVPYHPWQPVGRGMIGADESDGPATVRAKLAEALRRWDIPASRAPFLESMLAVESDESRETLSGPDGTELAGQIADTVRQCIRSEIHRSGTVRPHVLVFDDLHWADPMSLTLLREVALMTREEPLLLIGLTRPDRDAPSHDFAVGLREALGEDSTEMHLAPLDAGNSRTLLGNLLHVEDLSPDARALILKRSEGNPFFLEEVLRTLIDSGYVVREGDHWRAVRPVEEVAIPQTLAGVLSARIDRLPATTKRVTQTAAVLGRIFAQRALAHVCRSAPDPERVDDVAPHLGTLTYEELVRQKATEPEHEYIFKHALTQEAAYGTLLRSRRRDLHARAGRALEELYPDRLEELTPELAHHFREGGDHERAVQYAVRAAERALRLYALREALQHYERAYEVLGDWPDAPPLLRVDVILGWIWARHKLNDYQDVFDRLREAEEVARSIDDLERLARVLTWLANVHVLTGAPSRAMPFLMESQRIATELEDEQLLLLPYFFATEAMVDRTPAEAVEHMERVVEQARRYRMPEIEGHALGILAVAHARLGRYDEADRYIELALEAAPRTGAPVKEADVLIAVGFAYYDMGETEKGLVHLRLGAEKAHAVDAVECACAGFFGVGLGNLQRRELVVAQEEFRKSLRLADYSGWEGYVNRIRAGMAAAELEGGSPRALPDLESALRNARNDQDPYAESTLSEMLAEAHLALGDPERARTHLETALKLYRSSGMRSYEARALELAARVAEREGDAAQAQELRAEAEAMRATFRRTPGGVPDVVTP